MFIRVLFVGFLFFAVQKTASADSYVSFLQEQKVIPKCKYALEVGQQLYSQGQYDSSCHFFSYPIFQLDNPSTTSKSIIAESYYWLGYAHKAQNNIILAVAYYQKSLEAYEKINYRDKIAKLYWLIGELQLSQGEIKDAETNLLYANAMYSRIGRPEYEYIFQQNLGNLFWLKGNYRGAIDHLEKAIVLNQNDTDRLSQVYNLKGVCLRAMGKFDKAILCFNEAIDLAKNSEGVEILGWPLNNLGYLYNLQLNYDSAHYYYSKALELSDIYESHVLYSATNLNLAELNLAEGSPHKALLHLKQALPITRSLSDQIWHLKTLRLGVEISSKLGDNDAHIQFLNQYNEAMMKWDDELNILKSQLFNQQVTNSRLDLEVEQLQNQLGSSAFQEETTWFKELLIPLLLSLAVFALLVVGRWHWVRYRDLNKADILYKDLQRVNKRVKALEEANEKLSSQTGSNEAFKTKLDTILRASREN